MKNRVWWSCFDMLWEVRTTNEAMKASARASISPDSPAPPVPIRRRTGAAELPYMAVALGLAEELRVGLDAGAAAMLSVDCPSDIDRITASNYYYDSFIALCECVYVETLVSCDI